MAKQVEWTKHIVAVFEEEAMLSEIEKAILETRVRGIPISQQAIMFNMSESSVNRIIKTLKLKYDCVQHYHPDLPVRRKSREEIYMDNN